MCVTCNEIQKDDLDLVRERVCICVCVRERDRERDTGSTNSIPIEIDYYSATRMTVSSLALESESGAILAHFALVCLLGGI